MVTVKMWVDGKIDMNTATRIVDNEHMSDGDGAFDRGGDGNVEVHVEADVEVEMAKEAERGVPKKMRMKRKIEREKGMVTEVEMEIEKERGVYKLRGAVSLFFFTVGLFLEFEFPL